MAPRHDANDRAVRTWARIGREQPHPTATGRTQADTYTTAPDRHPSWSGAVLRGGGRSRVRTWVGEADGFTDRSLWPLGQPAARVTSVRVAQHSEPAVAYAHGPPSRAAHRADQVRASTASERKWPVPAHLRERWDPGRRGNLRSYRRPSGFSPTWRRRPACIGPPNTDDRYCEYGIPCPPVKGVSRYPSRHHREPAPTGHLAGPVPPRPLRRPGRYNREGPGSPLSRHIRTGTFCNNSCTSNEPRTQTTRGN